MRQRRTALLLAGWLAAGCRGDVIPNGPWGGDHVVFTVKDGGASVEFDCAHGTLDHPLKLDDRGQFSVPGTFVLEHGGPIRAGEVLPVHTARYQGRLDRQKVEFTVTIDGESAQGPFTVTLAKAAKLEKCV
jgi:hypothetical protein